ncbi:MAG TPA: cobalamin biosynthesis protein CobW [Erwinia persicina]|nr:cobalamin biosynthesis protein CobW [Erwinia persicina]HBH68524.1 cobalamin biosynthesis protein CobW [Erwinia persicina]HBT14867.1 cobalamin biosynthesis protein CobW [Erwinia persicina]
MQRIPLTVLNGFLGAGKTTLLKSLLMQAHRQHLSVSAIVNDMSELDIDGVLIANTEIVGREQHNFITVSADSISSRSGIVRLATALDTLVTKRRPDHIFLETSGSSHPLPLIKLLRDHPRVRLQGLLSLMDAVMLQNDYAGAGTLLPRWQENVRRRRRGIEDLLAEQLLFCSHLMLTKTDRLPAGAVMTIARALHQINPGVGVTALPWGNLPLKEVLAIPEYDFHRVAKLVDELEEVVEQPSGNGQPYEIESRVIEDDRPFHPRRLWDTCQQQLGEGIHRSKGFFWLPGRDDLALLWNQASGSIGLEFISYWKAGILAHKDNHLGAEERRILQQQLDAQPGRFGDRRCRLTVIGQRNQLDDFCLALHRCFLTEQEIVWWQGGGAFNDPWPQKVGRLKS